MVEHVLFSRRLVLVEMVVAAAHVNPGPGGYERRFGNIAPILHLPWPISIETITLIRFVAFPVRLIFSIVPGIGLRVPNTTLSNLEKAEGKASKTQFVIEQVHVALLHGSFATEE
jgi:hypothetical protein